MNFIPVNEPLLNGNEKKYLNQCIETGWISSEGEFVKRLESEFAARVKRKYAIAVCNGTAALDIAVAALGIGKGDEVILPTFTIISCAAAIVNAGATPVLVDCDEFTWNMNIHQIEEKITPKTKGIMVVHIYGLPTDMNPILNLADKYGLKIIEDAAEVHGQTYKNIPCGSFGEISTFSFYANKHITTGEGGMILTDDPNLAEKCRSYRNLCFQPQQRFIHEELGGNYRLSNLQAAVGVAQLERLDEFIARKVKMGQGYHELLSNISGLQLPVPKTDYAINHYWVYGVVLQEEIPFDAKEIMSRLKKQSIGIGTRPFFFPMHQQPVFRKMVLFEGESYPVAERIARRGFYIPSGLALTESQIDQVVLMIKEVLR